MAPTKPRDRILETAMRLFSRESVRSVSVNRIVIESDVALMTVYRQFGGKDELVAASLERWSDQWLCWLGDQIDRCGDDPDARFDGLWHALDRWLSSEDFHGSLVDNAASELRTPDHPAHKVIATHRMALRQVLEDLAKLSGAGDPADVADQLQVLIDGATTVAMIDRRLAVAMDVRALARTVLTGAD